MKMNVKRVRIKKNMINYTCLQNECKKSCCGPFGGVQREIVPIEDRQFSEIALTDKDAINIINHGFSNFVEKTKFGYYRMAILTDGTCQAWKNGRCSINSFKPTLCRAFPFYVDMFAGLCIITSCEGCGAGWTSLDLLKNEIDAAGEMYQFWVDRIRKNDEDSLMGKKQLLLF